MAVEIKVLRRGDESVLRDVAAEVFDNPIDLNELANFSKAGRTWRMWEAKRELLPLRGVPHQPPAGRIAFLWEDRPAALLPEGSHHVILGFVAFKRSSQKLIDLYRTIRGAVGYPELQNAPVGEVEQSNERNDDCKSKENSLQTFHIRLARRNFIASFPLRSIPETSLH